jgi:hypothetical protein
MSQFTSNMLAIYKFWAVAVLKFFRAPQFLGRIRDTSRIQERYCRKMELHSSLDGELRLKTGKFSKFSKNNGNDAPIYQQYAANE